MPEAAERSNPPALTGPECAGGQAEPVQRTPTARGSALLRVGLGLAVGVALLWVGLRQVEWADISAVLAVARWWWVALSWSIVLAGTLAKTFRWRCLLGPVAREVPLRRLIAIYVLGQFVNTVVPARMGEVARAYLASHSSRVGFGQALAAAIVEKVLDGLALLGIALLLTMRLALPEWFSTSMALFAIPLGGVVLAVLVATWARERIALWTDRLPGRLAQFARSGLDGLGTLRHRGLLAPGVLLTFGVWLLGLACNYTLFLALGLPATIEAALLLLVVHYLAVLIPGVPAQLGLFHGVTVLALGVLHVGAELAMPYAIVLHALVYGSILALGVLSTAMLSVSLGSLAHGMPRVAPQARGDR